MVAMRREHLVMTLSPVLAALLSCNQPASQNQFVEARQNGVAPAVTTSQPGTTSSSGNSLWGVAEAEDEASHRGIDFIAFNRTGQTVMALSIRPDEGPLEADVPENSWSENVLTQPELPDGQRASAHFEADIELCRWQVRATLADGRTRDYPTVNLCEAIRVDLR
jgi:hypothetical protein